MPCHPVEYPELTSIERELTTIYNILDDLNGTYQERNIYSHPKIKDVNCTKERLAIETESLCEILQSKTKAEIERRNFSTQRWWTNHQVGDFKRMARKIKHEKFDPKNHSDYELRLVQKVFFLDDLITDAFAKVENRFSNFNEQQNRDWQKNITRRSFVQVMSSFELFSELVYYRIHAKEQNDTLVFKEYDKSDHFWGNTLQESFHDWISFSDQFELKRYFEKYIHVVNPQNKALTYFDALETRTETGKRLVFTINDSKNLMRILRVIKDHILGKIVLSHN